MAIKKNKDENVENVPKLRAHFDVAKGLFVQDFNMSCLSFEETPHFFLDGLIFLPTENEMLLVTRLIMAPTTLKHLKVLIDRVIEDYEKKNGEIKISPPEITHIEKEIKEPITKK